MTETDTNKDHSPVVINQVLDPSIRSVEVGKSRGEWLEAMRTELGAGAFALAAAESGTPVFGLVVETLDDGNEAVRYTRIDQADFGTNLRNPDEYGLPSAEQKLAAIREAELEKAVSSNMVPLRRTVGMVHNISRQPDMAGIDGALAPMLRRELLGAEETEPAGLVDGADILLRFGAVSPDVQANLTKVMAEKLSLSDDTTRVFGEMVTNVRNTRSSDAHLDAVLQGIHGHVPQNEPEDRQRTFQAWMSAYATGVAFRMRRPDADGQAIHMENRVRAALRKQLEAARKTNTAS